MTLAINDEHQELSRVARAFLEDQDARAAARALLDAPQAALPPFWKQLAELGWLGLHLPERFGGEGFGLLELGVVVEALGHAVAPGPYLPTVLTSAVVLAAGEDALREEWLPGLADGSVVGGVALRASLSRDASGGLDGRAEIVLGADLADILLLPVGEDLVLLERNQLGVEIETLENLDPTRRVAAVRCRGVSLVSSRVLPGALDVALRLGRSLAVAEAAGGAHACSEMATAYAAERVQFGRPIATFQAVKHHCANMRVAAEQATALAWDALQSASDTGQGDLSAAAAAAIALPAFEQCAKQNIQVHGGIGFTWEHDAHLYLRRAKALQAIFGSAAEAERDVAKLSLAGVRSERGLELPAEAAAYRTEARDFVTRYRALPASEQRAALADSGYLMPHWPKPWGRAAGPVEQIVIEEEFASLARPNLGIGGWVTLTLAQNASEEQRQRWVRPSLMGDIVWCQLFSEPGAGSDAAAVQTRAVRVEGGTKGVEGGWHVTGQKVWTSGGQRSTHGLATIRTSSEGRKHAGISVMVIGMQAKGVDVRPLREITGKALFNEVFFDDVFVPDSDVVGEVNQGWAVARSTLGNERVSIGGEAGASLADELSGLVQERAAEDPDARRELGALLAEDLSLRLMNLREIIRAVEGAEPSATGNVSKLIQSVHRQRCADFRLQLRGSGGALLDASGDAFDYLFTRALTIAGGTSEIVRNQIGERILGLPRDPLIR